MKLLTSDSRDSRYHYLADDGITALCSQKIKYPQDGIKGWRLTDVSPQPYEICEKCKLVKRRLEKPKPQKVSHKTRKEIELEKLARWKGI